MLFFESNSQLFIVFAFIFFLFFFFSFIILFYSANLFSNHKTPNNLIIKILQFELSNTSKLIIIPFCVLIFDVLICEEKKLYLFSDIYCFSYLHCIFIIFSIICIFIMFIFCFLFSVSFSEIKKINSHSLYSKTSNIPDNYFLLLKFFYGIIFGFQKKKQKLKFFGFLFVLFSQLLFHINIFFFSLIKINY